MNIEVKCSFSKILVIKKSTESIETGVSKWISSLNKPIRCQSGLKQTVK